MTKGEIARFEQFPLLSQCFRNLSAAEASKSVYMWERVNMMNIYVDNFDNFEKNEHFVPIQQYIQPCNRHIQYNLSDQPRRKQ